MNTEQLSKLIRNFKCLNETLIDITAINVLPTVSIRPFPQLYIINTDPFPNPGKHWVCVVFYNASKADYFASLGKHPEAYSRNLKRFIIENSKNKCTFIPKQIQSNSSDICGLYVVCFAMMRICFHIPLNRNESGRFGALKSDSTHHFFRNACTKSGSLWFSQFSGC